MPKPQNVPLARAIHQVYLEGFGREKGWSIKGIQQRLITSDILGLLRKDKGNEIFGYAIYSSPKFPLNKLHMLWEDGICLRKEAQGLGLTRSVFREAFALFPNHSFGWIGGRTQNPLVFKRYAKLGPVFPFDTPYTLDQL